ncbi:MAG: hypothetical protein KC800_16370 [Candidatus Eremiobacteraeota bacterium]|nr:hypothetical protein [Candidatus Eremiobacteraeota bacterium]
MVKNDLSERINQALNVTSPVQCNAAITECHYNLSLALREVLGTDSGANFHSWAVWGSKKAGYTIRQEDLEQAKDDAIRAGGACGLLVGVGVARFLEQMTGREFWYGIGSVTGPICGGQVGKLLAIQSRKKAAALVLDGNRLVLNDIGRVTAEFVTRFADGVVEEELSEFLGTLSDSLLRKAFTAYGEAALTENLEKKHQACYFGNCLAILYEHQKLQPYIKGAMPVVVRRCVTKRLLSFDIGPRKLSVSQDVPGSSQALFPSTLRDIPEGDLKLFLQRWDRDLNSLQGTAASDWTSLPQRMRYIVDLFRCFHLDPDVISAP